MTYTGAVVDPPEEVGCQAPNKGTVPCIGTLFPAPAHPVPSGYYRYWYSRPKGKRWILYGCVPDPTTQAPTPKP